MLNLNLFATMINKRDSLRLRRYWISIFNVLFCFLIVSPVMAAPTIILDGQQLTFDVPPAIEEDRTLVPLGAIFSALGADVRWEPQTKTVTLYKDNNEIKLAIDHVEAYVNDTTVTLDVPPKIIDGRTMVPLGFVSTALGASIRWDADTQTITIISNDGNY